MIMRLPSLSLVTSALIMDVLGKRLLTMFAMLPFAGQNDISTQLVAKDTAETYHFVSEVARKIPGVRINTTSIALLISDVISRQFNYYHICIFLNNEHNKKTVPTESGCWHASSN
jgi:hypothetical protein